MEKNDQNTIKTKICRECEKEKDLLINFYKNRRSFDGFFSWCKDCCAQYQRVWRGKEENKNYSSKYNGNHLIQHRISSRNSNICRKLGIKSPKKLGLTTEILNEIAATFLKDIEKYQDKKDFQIHHCITHNQLDLSNRADLFLWLSPQNYVIMETKKHQKKHSRLLLKDEDIEKVKQEYKEKLNKDAILQ